MGVLNVTPDSFSDGGRYLEVAAAVEQGDRLLDAGADVIDVGGESTRPGAAPVDERTELARTIPVVEALVSRGATVSIDTTKPAVARAAAQAGAVLVNDVSATLWTVAAELGVAWVAMHRKGTPATMQVNPRYDDVVGEVLASLQRVASQAVAAGVPEVWIDPGIGFGKTASHNWSLLRHLGRFVATGHPVVVGTSRKRFLQAVLAASDGVADVPADDRLEASVATATWAMAQGAAMVRVHDVLATVQAARVVAA
jgi:dihydropteroate synthase